ncbi:MAG: tetraether lipid synthase Tes [Candidatus Bathyarchaeota archaeon]
MKLIKETKSICPECFTVIDAQIFQDEENRVMMKKTCPKHGYYEDTYWSDYDLYTKADKFALVGTGLTNPRTKRTTKGCPFDCGICNGHKSHTALAIIDVTNRCNLRCPICFANAQAAGYVYEPTTDEIKKIIDNFLSNKPVKPPGLQFSGGEPTLRDDLPELVEYADKAGFRHIEINTNGIRIANSIDYCKRLLDAGANAIYLQFDGVTRDPYMVTRGVDLLATKLKVIENCRKLDYDAVVLVPTIVKGVNDHQIGDIVKFAAANSDVIRCINFQPVSITGRIDQKQRNEMRITIPDCMKIIEKQTEGQIKASDFYPVPFVVPMSQAIGSLKGHSYVEFTTHQHCGMATYILIKDNGKKMVPITKYGNIEKFMESMKKVNKAAKAGEKTKAKIAMLGALRYVKWGLLRKLILGVLKTGSYKSLADVHYKMIMIGMMHFMDPYNFDLERIERCTIHYGLPNGTIIPFCTMNSIHRPRIEKQFSVPIKKYRGKLTKTVEVAPTTKA